MRTLRPALALIVFGLANSLTHANDLPPANLPVEQVIDRLIDASLKENDVTPAGQADDFTLIRRLTLDLVGRIPTLPEVEAFVRSTDADKRVRLVERLMASGGYARYQGAQFDVMLGYSGSGRNRGNGPLKDYLTSAIAENRSWDKMFRELMLPNESDPKQKGASDFLRPRLVDQDRLTNDVSVSFFGVNVSCAQCHDHPLVKDWTQDHYYGMKSFLARTFEKNGFIGEQAAGVVKFKPNKGAEKAAKMMFLTGTVVNDPGARELTPAEQKTAKESKDKTKKDDKSPPPVPSFSARAQLVEVALKSENSDLFSRSAVNRLWHRFLGFGLVNPLDQMHTENPPSHPELLSWLARDLSSHGYDLKRLVRGIVLSKTYSRSSKTNSEAPPEAQYFAVAQLKPLTPTQLAASLKLVSQDPALFEKLTADDVDKKADGYERASRGLANLIAQPTDNFQIGVGEALLFSNGDMITKEFLSEGKDTLLTRLKGMPDPKAGVELLVKTVLGRPATASESKALTAFIAKRSGNPAEAYRQAMWALGTCPEFRFNH